MTRANVCVWAIAILGGTGMLGYQIYTRNFAEPEPPPMHTIAYYLQHDSERNAKMAQCRMTGLGAAYTNPTLAAECVNSEEASLQIGFNRELQAARKVGVPIP